MAKFSERYGYTNLDSLLIRERITEPLQNSILNWLYITSRSMPSTIYDIESEAYIEYFNKEMTDDVHLYMLYKGIIKNHFKDEDVLWYEKLNLLEYIFDKMKSTNNHNLDNCIILLNSEFARHNFAYRIVNNQVEEVTSESEIATIEEAVANPLDAVRTHLNTALRHASAARENPDYRNSIKESISAVEALCREITKKNTLGDALNTLKGNGVGMPKYFVEAIEKLYAYTNDKAYGIRHADMDGTNPPGADEAIYMLVTCSALINYLQKKISK